MQSVRLLAGLLAGAALFLPSPAALADRGAVIDRSAQILRERYLDAALGARVADGLLAQKAELDKVSDPQAYARAVTQAMQAIQPDLHLRMSYEPQSEFVPGSGAPCAMTAAGPGGQARQVVRTGRIDGRDAAAIARTNFGFEAVQRLDGNVGYLRLSSFVPLDLSRATAEAAMRFLANSDALIIDLRGNYGGAPETVGYIMSHFYAPDAPPTLLHASENRAAGVRSEVKTDPALGSKALAAVPVYVLIDRRSASAAEILAYSGARVGRVKVIGETSAGAGNGGLKYSVGQGYALFIAEWKVLTGPGWERVGVKPDVAVEPAAALATAHRLALQALAGQEAPPALREERERALSRL
ncbi:S41 family peptidase [Massilia sp. BSC265]|uniref:S41 family peptidase n=1 Tax=Massilia sp. BSC265 TaxID=1549812 RepID=UPI0004E8F412|nr:S41 family peptidase [Massilia sp. BSC265]KFI06768.1 hypothetical protein JN27_13925 [Massilia sp. BSC265]